MAYLNRVVALLLPGLLVASVLAFPLGAKEKPKPHALLLGSIFTAEGLSLPGVPVTITLKAARKPRWRAVSDRRGEFAIRLPAGRATYEVTTHSKEHQNETKTVEIYGEESVSIIFQLSARKPENKQ